MLQSPSCSPPERSRRRLRAAGPPDRSDSKAPPPGPGPPLQHTDMRTEMVSGRRRRSTEAQTLRSLPRPKPVPRGVSPSSWPQPLQERRAGKVEAVGAVGSSSTLREKTVTPEEKRIKPSYGAAGGKKQKQATSCQFFPD